MENAKFIISWIDESWNVTDLGSDLDEAFGKIIKLFDSGSVSGSINVTDKLGATVERLTLNAPGCDCARAQFVQSLYSWKSEYIKELDRYQRELIFYGS